jgi:hypothetical protein
MGKYDDYFKATEIKVEADFAIAKAFVIKWHGVALFVIGFILGAVVF